MADCRVARGGGQKKAFAHRHFAGSCISDSTKSSESWHSNVGIFTEMSKICDKDHIESEDHVLVTINHKL